MAILGRALLGVGVLELSLAPRRRRTELRRGVDGELTLPAIPGQELGAQSTHQLTLKLTEPIVARTHSHMRRICLGGRKKMNSDTGELRAQTLGAERRFPIHRGSMI
jgi:hypothetical protein